MLLHLRIVSKSIPNSRLGWRVPDQDLAQNSSHLLVDILLGSTKLDVHVAVDADQLALVLGLAPLESDNDVLVDAATEVSILSRCVSVAMGHCELAARRRASMDVQVLQHRPRINRHELSQAVSAYRREKKKGG